MGGGDNDKNKSLVERYKHEAWHVLFDNFPALQMFQKFKDFYEVFGFNGESEFQKRRAREWVRTKKSRMKKQQAWRDLFGSMGLAEIVQIINDVWIDPDYEIVIGIQRIPKVRIVSKRIVSEK